MNTIHRLGRRRNSRRLAAVAVAGLLAAAAGFAGPSAVARPAAAPAGLAWGQTYAYANGLAVTVTPPAAFAPSDTSAGHRAGNQAVAWKITVKNGTPDSFRTGLVSVYAKYGAAGEQAERVVDSAKGAGSDFEGSISPGRSATVTYVFDVPKAGVGLLDLEVVPDAFAYEGTHWSGPLGAKTGRQ
ncbi:hypothetical protein ABT024_36880 [Streptomyces sp. NPDC002812]|uniref:hypothetical protein n=1 Tax=Streptomyces sp. NPDC002812 TaxID=3154434 RepID=UPI003329BF5A